MAKTSNGVIGALHKKSKNEASLTPLSQRAKGDRPFSSVSTQARTKSKDEGYNLNETNDFVDEGDGLLKYLDPNDIVSWENKDRSIEEMEDDPAFQDLVQRISVAGGNIQPIKVRPIRANHAKYEEIYGAKRLNACKKLGFQVYAIIQELDDKEAWRQQENENAGRSDNSAWAKAVSWSNAVEKKLVSSIDDLAIETNRSKKLVNSYLRVYEDMDTELIERVKLYKLGIQSLYELRSGLLRFESNPKKKEEYIDRVIEIADLIEAGKASPAVFAGLAKKVANEETERKENTFTSAGAKMFSIKEGKQGYTVKMHFGATKNLPSSEIQEVIKRHLESKGIDFD